jgi:aconitate hydratase
MGQAPATGSISLRTTPRNFPGRSGTREDQVHLCSPETAIASALAGVITDPRDLAPTFDIAYPAILDPTSPTVDDDLLLAPPEPDESAELDLEKGPNIASLPDFEPLPDSLEVPVLLKVGDDISTDEILRAGTEVLPFRSNIPKIAEFTYDIVDETYPSRAKHERDEGAGGHVIVGGTNYGQGSSREHAAIAPRYLGLRVVLAKDYARIHWQNLANFGVVALEFDDPDDYDRIEQGDTLRLSGLRRLVEDGNETSVEIDGKGTFTARHRLSERQRAYLLTGGTTNWMRERV